MSEEVKVETKTPKSCIQSSKLSARHSQVLMMGIAMAICYSMRVNMSFAIVAMTDKSSKKHFDWSMQKQSVILSSFFWGYIVLQIPAGELAVRFGGKILLIIAVSVNSILSFLIPTAAYHGGWKYVCACRVLQGLAQGFLFPSTHNLIGKWAPLEEKSRLGTMVYSSCQIGMALQNLSSGFLAEYYGWSSIFYVDGAMGVMWTIVYIFAGADSPQTSKTISETEKLYIQTSLGHVGGHKKLRTPWKSVFTSVPLLALMIVHGGQNWGYFTMMTELPTYMAKILFFGYTKNGILSSLPYIAVYLMSFPVGFIADFILKRKLLTTTTTRKIFNSIGLYGPALALIALSWIKAGPDHATVSVILLIVIVGVNAGHYAGFMLVHIDMAPNFAGSLMGVTNCFANIISLIAPLAAGAMLENENSAHDWRKVFYVASAVYIFTNSVFLIFGSAEKQDWNDDPEETVQDKSVKEA